MSFVHFLRQAERFARNAAPVVKHGVALAGAVATVGRELRGPADEQFRATHGGRAPHESMELEVPRTGEKCARCGYSDGVKLIELGELDSIVYWADKGDGYRQHVHDFGEQRDGSTGALPILCFASDRSGLVIAHGLSPYIITTHGIEG